MDTLTEILAPTTKRPKILDDILPEIDENSRKEDMVKQKRDLESKIMERLANIRIQESLVEQKTRTLEELPDDTPEEDINVREKALAQAEMYLEDLYQGGVALSEEFQKVKAALEDMKSAGLAPFGNRGQRRSRKK